MNYLGTREVRKRIDDCKKNKEENLDLSYRDLTTIPKEINELVWLHTLSLDSNQLTKIENLENLSQLHWLYLDSNSIENLESLLVFIKDDKIKIVWKENYLVKSGEINVKDNPIKTPSIDIVKKGNAAIRRYFKELDKGKERIYESRLLIVGQGQAGKTSLKKKLLDKNAEMPVANDTTRGIEIDILPIPLPNGKEFSLRIWDFGGQNIQHYAHQFFLSDSSLYALVHNQRQQNTHFHYWLNIIEMLGKNSPVIIVQNEQQGHTEPFKNLKAIKGRYQNVEIPIHQVNIKEANTDTRFEILAQTIQKIATDPKKLHHLEKIRPKSFIDLRAAIEKMANKGDEQFITWKTYQEICADQGITDKELMSDYSKTMTILGICLHFPEDMDLKDYVFLRPKWIIDALFALLYNEQVIQNKGKFCELDTSDIWKDTVYDGMHPKLVRLMVNFELCYPINPKRKPKQRSYLVPQRLPAADQNLPWNDEDKVSLIYRYAFIPSGILTRLTCRMHELIEGNHVWSDMVIFHNKKGARVLVKKPFGKHEIHLEATGIKRSDLLNRIVEELDEMHSETNFANLVVDKLLPCDCRQCKRIEIPHLHKYDVLVRRLNNGRPVHCDISDEQIDIKKFLAHIFENGDMMPLYMKMMERGFDSMHGRMERGFKKVNHQLRELKNEFGKLGFLMEKLDENYQEAAFDIIQSLDGISDTQLADNWSQELLLEKITGILDKMDNSHLSKAEKQKVKDEIVRNDVSLKHKIKWSVPLTLVDFWNYSLKYEAEFEFSNKQKVPRNFKEFSKLFLTEE